MIFNPDRAMISFGDTIIIYFYYLLLLINIVIIYDNNYYCLFIDVGVRVRDNRRLQNRLD